MFVKDTVRGILSYLEAGKYVFRSGLLWLAIAPGLISGVISFVLIRWLWVKKEIVGDLVVGWYPWERGSVLVESVGTWLSFVLVLLGYVFLIKYIVLVVGAPFMAPFSAKIEQMLRGGTGTSPSAMSMDFVHDIVRSLGINLRNVWREILLTILLFVLSFIPGFGLLTTPLIFLVGAYYAGFGNMDFALERHFGYRDTIRFVQKNRGLALGNGIVFILAFSIPVIGAMLILPFATAAATIEVSRKLDGSGV